LNDLAPIVLFVYNRPDHTNETLQALQKNTLSQDSELFIYADAAKNETAQRQVDEVREVIYGISGFKKVTVIQQEKNIGLANSIIGGVSEIVKKYGKIIVIEDDLVTSPYFLKFMNSALDFYAEKKGVWHISGWNYPIETAGLADTFLWRTMNCWGWATWNDRWGKFEKNTDRLIDSFNSEQIKSFNLDGYENFWGQVLANKEGRINTWAIYWYASIFNNNGLCLNPSETFVSNIGLDGSGVHCGVNASYVANLNGKNNIKFETILEENGLVLERIQLFYKKMKKSLFVRIVNKIARVVIKNNIIT
jgi:hypothetical protein